MALSSKMAPANQTQIYASVADTDAYFQARGIDSWAASSPSSIKEAALRNATEYLEIVYGASFAGNATDEQALSWPRKNA
jgi:glutamine synthetase type III